MKKGISPIISTVFLILISISVIYLALNIIKPTIDLIYQQATLRESEQNIRMLSNLIKEVASEGIGSSRSFILKVSDGYYMVNNLTNSFEFEYEVSSKVFPPNTFIKSNEIMITGYGTIEASAMETSEYLILENKFLKIFLQKIGNETNFQTLNTSRNIRKIQFKETGLEISPLDSSIQVGDDENTKWGIGYSKLIRSGKNLPVAEALFHIVSSKGTVYNVIYSLPSSSDFLTIRVENITKEEVTMTLIYHIGSQAYNDTIKIAGMSESYYQSGG